MTTVLVVDDEPGVRDLLCDALRIAGYETETAANGVEAFEMLHRHRADLCIVDINMPSMNGFEFLSKLREHDTETPVLMLSARDSNDDVAQGLRYGADDYVRKPFSLEELLLRVKAILRRAMPGDDDVHYECGRLTMNVDRHEVFLDEEPIELSATEFRLLEVLMERKNRLVTREQLLREVWNIDFDSETSVLDTYVSYLRRKVHRDGFAPVTTVRGVGFKLVDESTK
ncbi:MAG: response regulator transcription factor [Acidimicrobiales bacterium]